MEEDAAPFGQREGHGAESAAYGLDVCSASVDVCCVTGGDFLAEVFVENGAISGGGDVIGHNGVA